MEEGIKRGIKHQKLEKYILKISLFSGIFFVVIQIFMALYSKSQAVLTDSIFDAIELIVITISIFLVPMLYRPITEKNPYGFAQMESLFLVFKGFMMIAVTLGVAISNIQILITGGNTVDNYQIAIFELILAIISSFVYLTMKAFNRKVSSPTIDLEIYSWKIDFLCSFAVSVAFIIPTIFKNSFFEAISPYLDQIVVLIIIVVVLPEPIKVFLGAFKDIFLFAPEKDIMDKIKKETFNVFEKYNFEATFFDVTKTGRKIWIEIYFKTDENIIKTEEIKEIRTILVKFFEKDLEHIYLELIPDVD